MDAFYASVEQRDNPELRGKPLAVGHAEQRGVVAAASYEARKYGVRSAMASQKAKRLCPDLIFVHGRMDVYKSVSRQIHEIFHDYTDIIEPLSLDEAFLDVTDNKRGISLAVDIAKEIKKRIWDNLNLIALVGVSYNKFLAKIASDYRKPNGLCTIHPSQALDFIAHLPIESFWGVGPVTARKMHTLGIHNGLQLRECSGEMLTRQFGKAGILYYEFARGRQPSRRSGTNPEVGRLRAYARKRYLPQILCYHRALSRSDRTYRQAGTFRIQGKHTDLKGQVPRFQPNHEKPQPSGRVNNLR